MSFLLFPQNSYEDSFYDPIQRWEILQMAKDADLRLRMQNLYAIQMETIVAERTDVASFTFFTFKRTDACLGILYIL